MKGWINTTKRVWKNAVRPCRMIGFCPYGPIVEEYPADKDSEMRCGVFAHDCPVFYQASFICESEGKDYDASKVDDEVDRFFAEAESKVMDSEKSVDKEKAEARRK